jgi:hypothetical protein
MRPSVMRNAVALHLVHVADATHDAGRDVEVRP